MTIFTRSFLPYDMNVKSHKFCKWYDGWVLSNHIQCKGKTIPFQLFQLTILVMEKLSFILLEDFGAFIYKGGILKIFYSKAIWSLYQVYNFYDSIYIPNLGDCIIFGIYTPVGESTQLQYRRVCVYLLKGHRGQRQHKNIKYARECRRWRIFLQEQPSKTT